MINTFAKGILERKSIRFSLFYIVKKTTRPKLDTEIKTPAGKSTGVFYLFCKLSWRCIFVKKLKLISVSLKPLYNGRESIMYECGTRHIVHKQNGMSILIYLLDSLVNKFLTFLALYVTVK
jgi:hypothetical protein